MNVKEGERTIIAKPVASRPTISDFKSFSQLIAAAGGATNGSPSSEPIVTAIRPKTVRFKPAMSSAPAEMVSSQTEFTGTQACHSSDKISKSNHTSPLLYKPLAKTVSRKAISLLANMETFKESNEQALAQNPASQTEMVNGTNLPNMTPVKSGNERRPQLCTINNDGCYDGYNWRKYGQKQVKGSEYPRSYYKCTNPNCMVKKKVERSIDGKIAEIVYKGEHNHTKPRVPRRHAFDGTSEDLNQQYTNNQVNNNELLGSSSRMTNLVKVKESNNHVSSEEFDPLVHEASTSKRRRSLSQVNGLQEPRVVVHDGTDSEAISDGFRWRKYGQKIVKGNPYPRSYYRCTSDQCDVRKHVERASDDPSVFITTYEGKHNHEMPNKKPN